MKTFLSFTYLLLVVISIAEAEHFLVTYLINNVGTCIAGTTNYLFNIYSFESSLQ